MQCNITRSLYSRRHCLDAANSGMGELALHAKTPSQKCTAQTSPILSPYLPLTMTVAHTVPVFFDITISARKVRGQRKSSENGTVSNTAESPVGGRPLCEARPNVVRQLYFSKIAVRSAIRSTLLTAERLAATSEGRTSYIACKVIHEQEEWAKVYANERVETCLHTKRVLLNLDAVNGAPVCRGFCYFLTPKSKDSKTTKRI